jgi:glycolate oxidase iron-sulfur subunit
MKGYGKFKNAALCTHCGYCLPACPSYRVLNDETVSPRGRISIIIALAREELKAEEASAALSTCLVCRACHSACPVGVRPAKLVLSARNANPIPTSLLGSLLHRVTNNHTLTALASQAIQIYQKRGLQGRLRRWKVLQIIPPLHKLEALIPAQRNEPIPPYPNQKKNPDDKTAPQQRAALLCGCMGRLFHPGVAPSTANLLDMMGIEVTVMDGFGCCGAPFRESGNRELFLKQARRTLEAFSKIPDEVDLVLCDTSVCMITIRSYARALAQEKKYADLAKSFVEKTQSLETILADGLPKVVHAGYQTGKSSITFHDHCQTRHGLGAVKEPRELLKKYVGSLSELPRAESCCGAGGDYMLRYPELSHKIRLDKLEAIIESKAETVVGTNSGCLLNIENGLKKKQATVQVRHLTELLWQSIEKLKNKEVSP